MGDQGIKLNFLYSTNFDSFHLSWCSAATYLFAACAVLTSVLGTYLALEEFVYEALDREPQVEPQVRFLPWLSGEINWTVTVARMSNTVHLGRHCCRLGNNSSEAQSIFRSVSYDVTMEPVV